MKNQFLLPQSTDYSILLLVNYYLRSYNRLRLRLETKRAKLKLVMYILCTEYSNVLQYNLWILQEQLRSISKYNVPSLHNSQIKLQFYHRIDYWSNPIHIAISAVIIKYWTKWNFGKNHKMLQLSDKKLLSSQDV